jgi:hypothetical protein
MKIAVALTLALASPAMAQLAPNDLSRSASGQFIVTSHAGDLRLAPAALATNTTFLRLEPSFTAVSTERTKQAVQRLLGVTESWEQPVTVTLLRTRTPNDPITVTPGYLGSRRAYHVKLPAVIAPDRYLCAITEAILLEMAGRKAGEAHLEIPSWLVEGMAYQLLCNDATELLLSSPNRQDNGLPINRTQLEFRRLSALEKAHRILVGTTPLSFEELSWPLPNQLHGDGHDVYRASAQVFLINLLKFPDGQACLRKFLESLPAHQNWQMAFLKAFAPHFKRPLDIEKWWALEGLNFAGRDLTQTWPLAESWEKLEAVLTENVDVFTSTNSLPERSQLSLAQMIQTWTAEQQTEALGRKCAALRELQFRIAPELHPLTADYWSVLNDYLKVRSSASERGGAGRMSANTLRYAELRLLKRLDVLEAKRASLRPGQTNPNPAGMLDTAVSLREMRLPASALRAN